jgi:hypothetical protein
VSSRMAGPLFSARFRSRSGKWSAALGSLSKGLVSPASPPKLAELVQAFLATREKDSVGARPGGALTEAVDLYTPRGLALVAGVVLALVAIFLHFSVFGAATSYGFWMMGLAYVVTALFGAGMVGD